MKEKKWDGTLIGLVSDFLPMINISDSSKEKIIERLQEAEIQKTIINCSFEYKGRVYNVTDILPHYLEEETAIFLYDDGNYSDDETRRNLINKKYGNNTIPKLQLGSQEIELIKINIEYE
jgi:hypothetical protein